ncbi:MAG: bifunctional aldolase/short-chain dehydrogenase, partial [Verrucomicrobia bacterium]|nr:bifunctional aldolase/short-chain dehydrogenase [Verrucomicrobiota bacterium]
MKNRWSDSEARRWIRQGVRQGQPADVSLRIYTTRLLGENPELVLHGGGNTSVKTVLPDVLGNETEVLCVKGSGWDMAKIEAAGLPALRLDRLLELRSVPTMDDVTMMKFLRSALLDPGAVNPSVETLLHAFLPHKFIDHTHASAILSISNQPDAEKVCRKVFGDRMVIVPYIMPGYPLAHMASRLAEQHPEAEGMILLHHGIFTWGETSREAYDRMIQFVGQAQRFIAGKRRKTQKNLSSSGTMPAMAEVAPAVRGALALPCGDGKWHRWILDFRNSPRIQEFLGHRNLRRWIRPGVVTPEQVIRNKPFPMLAPQPGSSNPVEFRRRLGREILRFHQSYKKYFTRCAKRSVEKKQPLDPAPRVVLVPGMGFFGIGRTAAEAKVSADVYENAIRVILHAERVGRFVSIRKQDIFDVEYWSLEQAKLAKGASAPLTGQVALVTGGGSGIGEATARLLSKAGARVVVADQDAGLAEKVAMEIGGLGIGCDVTRPSQVRKTFDQVCSHWGGVDLVVSNAGAAWQGRVGEVSENILRKSFELNFFAHQTVAQNAVRVMRVQGTGGCLLFNVSKQA